MTDKDSPTQSFETPPTTDDERGVAAGYRRPAQGEPTERRRDLDAADAAFKLRDEQATWGDVEEREAAVRWHWRGFQDGAQSARRPVQGEPTDSWAGRARRAEAALLRVRDIHIATMEALSETFSAVAITEQGENRD